MVVFELIAGVILVTVVLFDVFESVVLPRRAGNLFRLAPHLLALPWPVWRRIGLRLQPAWRREDFLGTFPPLAIVLLLVLWFAGLIVGFGLISIGCSFLSSISTRAPACISSKWRLDSFP